MVDNPSLSEKILSELDRIYSERHREHERIKPQLEKIRKQIWESKKNKQSIEITIHRDIIPYLDEIVGGRTGRIIISKYDDIDPKTGETIPIEEQTAETSDPSIYVRTRLSKGERVECTIVVDPAAKLPGYFRPGEINGPLLNP